MVKRISYAVGLEILVETYRKVLERAERKHPFRVLNLAVKINHSPTLSANELEIGTLEPMWEDA
jgi:hypothetical protein